MPAKVVAIKESQLGVGSVLAHGLCLPPLCLLPTALISLHDNLHDLSLLRATQTTLRCITDNNHPTLYPFKRSHKSKSSQMQSHILLHSLLVFIFNADLVSAQAPSLPRYVFSAIYAFHNLKNSISLSPVLQIDGVRLLPSSKTPSSYTVEGWTITTHTRIPPHQSQPISYHYPSLSHSTLLRLRGSTSPAVQHAHRLLALQ